MKYGVTTVLRVAVGTLAVAVIGWLAAFSWTAYREASPSPAAEAAKSPQPGITVRGDRVVRQPGAHEMYYASQPAALLESVRGLLNDSPRLGLPGVRAVVVPHGPFDVSGKIAAAAFRELDPGFKRVFVLAANHYNPRPFAGVSLPRQTHFLVPGAEVAVSPICRALLSEGSPFVDVPEAHSTHVVEVQLPLLVGVKRALLALAPGRRSVFELTSTHPTRLIETKPMPEQNARSHEDEGFEIVPMVIGDLDEAGRVRVTETLARFIDDETVFVVSLDLSHTLPSTEAMARDMATVGTLLARNAGVVREAGTDGDQVLDILLRLSRSAHWEPTFLAYTTRAEATKEAHDRGGYGALAFHEPFLLTKDARDALLTHGRRVLEGHLAGIKETKIDPATLARLPGLAIRRDAYASIARGPTVLGTGGEPGRAVPLHESVAEAVVAAARASGPRLKGNDLASIALTLSVAEPQQVLEASKPDDLLGMIKPGVDGVTLERGGKTSSLVLTRDGRSLHAESMLETLCLQQGAPGACWRSAEARLRRFRVLEMTEGT